MCGFVGFFGGDSSRNSADHERILQGMTDAISHRGPDDEGHWWNRDSKIFLGHRRLSIVDLSAAGHQPMLSPSGQYVIAYNGEIYSHLSLRKSLESSGKAPVWHGHSDTETLLAGFDAWGIQNTIKLAIGMFAFAVWDTEQRVLTLVRDRVGEKPLYYGWQGGTFLFGSELKSFRVHPAFQGEIDRGALSLFMRHNAIPAPYTIYKGISKLLPGYSLRVSLKSPEPHIEQYWSGVQIAESGVSHTFNGSVSQAINELEALLKDAVLQQMMADVPLGAFLSGGVDSSTIVALMQAQSSRPIKTFTIGFDEEGYNEAKHAKAVATHLGTDHTELYVSPRQAMDVIPSLPTLYDEPFSDSSQIPTFLVSRLARQHVTVSLSGDAGDELFCGYQRYFLARYIWGGLSILPHVIRNRIARGLISVQPETWSRLTDSLLKVVPRKFRYTNVGDKLHKLAGVLDLNSFSSLYRSLVSHWPDPARVVLGGVEPPTQLALIDSKLQGLGSIQRMMLLDMLTYLSDDILVKVDRAAMGVSLETRIPMLDHRVVEFAWRLPQPLKIREGQTKWILRQVLYRHVPKKLIERPKMGFGIPIDQWLRGSLRDWAEDLLDETRLKSEGYFDPHPIRLKWQEHLSGKRNWQYHLWDILMFELWLGQSF